MKVDNKVPLCPDCVSIYREQPEKRGLLMAQLREELAAKAGPAPGSVEEVN